MKMKMKILNPKIQMENVNLYLLRKIQHVAWCAANCIVLGDVFLPPFLRKKKLFLTLNKANKCLLRAKI